VAATRVISVVGKKNAGKTTLVVALVQEYVRRGRKVGTLKHGHHPALVDQEGKDTWRHFHEGGAIKTLIEAPSQRVLFEKPDSDAADPVDLIRRYLRDVDIVVVEGFKKAPLPKIEVHRRAVHDAPIYDPSSPDAGQWVGMITDDVRSRCPFPVFTFTDTAWFTTLAHLAWERALVVDL
jgi:molybdopterin-guanine dinucleotide biosynthesis protein MobB